jgi:hypothetical protein
MPLRLPLVAITFIILSVLRGPLFGAEPEKSGPAAKGVDGAKAASAEPAPAEFGSDEAKPDGFDLNAAVGRLKSSKTTVHPNSVFVATERTGRRTLSIDYRWQMHPKASVEVRLVPSERAARGTTVVPVCFAGEQMKGKIQEKVYKCLDSAETQDMVESFTKDKMVYRIVGAKNSLGRAAVYVLPYNEGEEPEQRPGAVFLQLDAWSLGDHELSLDLPRDVFKAKGLLFVWFLRGEKVLWEEKVAWPGYGIEN